MPKTLLILYRFTKQFHPAHNSYFWKSSNKSLAPEVVISIKSGFYFINNITTKKNVLTSSLSSFTSAIGQFGTLPLSSTPSPKPSPWYCSQPHSIVHVHGSSDPKATKHHYTKIRNLCWVKLLKKRLQNLSDFFGMRKTPTNSFLCIIL